MAFRQTFFRRRFNTHKNRGKTGINHHLHQFRVICQIDGSLGNEVTAFLSLSPANEGRQNFFFELLTVTDEIVIHKKDISAPAQRVHLIQLGNDLSSSFGSRTVSQHCRYITKITVERAAARILNTERIIIAGIHQLP